MVGSQLMEMMMDDKLQKQWSSMLKVSRLETLVKDCQSDLAKYLVPDAEITEKEIISQLLERLDGPQAREALDEQR